MNTARYLARIRTPHVMLALVLVVLLALTRSASACPVCHTETGKQVRAGIFDEQFGKNFILTLAPVPVLIGTVLLIHHGPFTRRQQGAPKRFRT